MKNLISKKRMGFSTQPLHQSKEPHAMFYMKQKLSFWIATLSLMAFVTGNMMGQHGWHAFWKSVLGKTDDSLIVYVGTVPPIAKVPDYERWYELGGNPEEHTFRQAPHDILIPLPEYNVREQSRSDIDHWKGSHLYSVGYMGSYTSGAEHSGSHPGVDIRAPEGTPVQSIANGIVDEVKNDEGGFGHVLVVRHPNVPNPDNPTETTTLYSSYAHLSAIYVTEGEIVYKAQHVADTGNSGYSSGPHLHFQIDTEEAPWHPFWPFTGAEARAENLSFAEAINTGFHKARGMKYTVHPMLYTQANYPGARTEIVSADVAPIAAPVLEIELEPVHGAAPKTLSERVAARKAERIAAMIARRDARMQARLDRREQEQPSLVITREQIVSADPTVAPAPSSNIPVSAQVTHDRSFNGQDWETLRITLKNEDGDTLRSPELSQDLYLKTAYGTAEFKPEVLSHLDFVDGTAEVKMLPEGDRTIVIQVKPFLGLSAPMEYEK